MPRLNLTRFGFPMPSISVGAAMPDLPWQSRVGAVFSFAGVASSELLDRSCAVWSQASYDFSGGHRNSKFGGHFIAFRTRTNRAVVCGRLLVSDNAGFRTMLASPSNLDATLQYAVNTKKVGDIEASIDALERLLFYNPNLSRVRFELGTLYFRLGSYEMARGYFQTAQASSDATSELKQRAQDFIDTIDKKLQPDQWSGFAQTGLRYQTNASLGPNQQSLFGATRPINSQFVARPDWNWFGIFRVNYVHDFGNQSGDVFEANLFGYDAQQFKNTAVDAGLLDLRIGPRFGIFQDVINGASIKLYVVANGATLADAPYLGSYGGGVTMHVNLANVALDPYVEFRRLDYRSFGLYPLASGLDGTLATYALQAGGPIFQGLRWQARFAFNRAD